MSLLLLFPPALPVGPAGSVSRAGLGMLFDKTGLLTYCPNNLYINSGAATNTPRTITTQAGVNYYIWIKTSVPVGSNSATIVASGTNTSTFTGSPTGTFTKFTASSGTLTLTPGVNYQLITQVIVAAITYETTARPGDNVVTSAAAYYGRRDDYNPSTLAYKGVLVEQSRQNILAYSNTFTNAAWTQSNILTPVQNVTGPDGVANSAWTLTAAAGNSEHRIYQNAGSADYQNWSLFAKAGTASFISLSTGNAANPYAVFNLNTGAVATTSNSNAIAIPLGNGWYRLLVSTTISTSSFYVINIGTSAANVVPQQTWNAAGTETVYIYNSQSEQIAAASSFCTSPIISYTSSVTRAPETFSTTDVGSITVKYIDEATGAENYTTYTNGSSITLQNAWVETVSAYQAETNTHFIGGFAAIKYNSFAFNTTGDTPVFVPQPETNPHFIGQFTPVNLSGFSYNSGSEADAPVVETNPHFVGKFTPPKLSGFAFNTTGDTPVVVAQPETNTHFIGRYAQAIYNRFIYNHQDGSQPPAAETNPHFIGRFTPASLGGFKYNTRASDPPVQETNTHFIGKFLPTTLSQFRFNHQDGAQPPVTETNTHFIGKFTPAALIQFRFNHQDGAQPPSVETNTHFVGKFSPATLSRFAFNSPADSPLFVVQPETNTHFVGKFTPVALSQFRFNHQDGAQPRVAETNPHFIGRFTSIALNQFRYNHTDVGQPPVKETNTHFVGRFSPAKLSQFRYNHTDTAEPPTAETNPHFIGKFTPASLSGFKYNTRASDPPVQETNPHFIGRFVQTSLIHFGYNSSNDYAVYVAQPETNPSFIGKFSPVTYNGVWSNILNSSPAFDVPVVVPPIPPPVVVYRLGLPRDSIRYRRNDDSSIVKQFIISTPTIPSAAPANEANPHFIGKFTPANYNLAFSRVNTA